MTYDPIQILTILCVFVLAATAKGITGLGFTTVCLPFLTVVVGLKEAMALVLLPSVASNLAVMHGAGAFRETLDRFWPMLLATVPGLILGLWLLARVDGATAGAILGVVLMAWCAFSWARPAMRLPGRLARPLGPVSGFLTGVINGVTGSQVMPSMPYLMALDLPRGMFLQAINCSFTLSSVVMAVGLGRLGLFTAAGVAVSAAGIVVAFAGLRLGERLRARLSPGMFRHAVLTMLAVMGIALVARGL